MPDSVSSPRQVIRDLSEADCETIAQAFFQQGSNKPARQYRAYYQDMLAGRRDVLVIEVEGEFAGYLTVVWESDYAPFRAAGIPEIVDFNVLEKFRRRGLGTALMDAAEQRIAARSPVAGIGVGLTADYGPAQVLYIRRGYVPDGRGAASHGQALEYDSQVPVDDDLALYMTKDLGR